MKERDGSEKPSRALPCHAVPNLAPPCFQFKKSWFSQICSSISPRMAVQAVADLTPHPIDQWLVVRRGRWDRRGPKAQRQARDAASVALFRRVRRGDHPAPARLSARAAIREIVKYRAATADAGLSASLLLTIQQL